MQMKLVLWPNIPSWAKNDESAFLSKTNIHSLGCITTGTSTKQNDCERLRLLNSSALTEWLKGINPENERKTKIEGFYRHKYAKKENEADERNLILLPGINGKIRVGLGFMYF